MFGNKATVVCIDNFSEFDGPRKEFLENFNKYKGENDATFIEGNCWDVDLGDSKFNIYLYDGAHEYEDHFKALDKFYKNMDDTFIFVVDDWNWKKVRDGTIDAIKKLNLNIIFKHEVLLASDDQHTPYDIGKFSWWNGICIFVLSKTHTIFSYL